MDLNCPSIVLEHSEGMIFGRTFWYTVFIFGPTLYGIFVQILSCYICLCYSRTFASTVKINITL